MAKKINKYSSGVFVDSQLVQPRKSSSDGFVSVQETLDALERASKIKNAITGSLGSILTVVLLGYGTIAGTHGFFANDVDDFSYVTRPAFAQDVFQGGYISKTGVSVYASRTNLAPDNFFGNIQTAFLGSPSAVKGEVIYGGQSFRVKIDSELKSISIVEGNNLIPVEGIYNGLLEGDNALVLDQYLIKCTSGDCTKGEVLFVNKDNIHGVF
jgi:hypothetical protein